MKKFTEKFDRDLLIYQMWQLGRMTNQEIGEKFGLTYSAVGRKVSISKDLFSQNKVIQNKYNQIKSQIKI